MFFYRFLHEELIFVIRFGFLWILIGLPLGVIWAVKGFLQTNTKKRFHYFKLALISGTGGFVILLLFGLIYELMIIYANFTGVQLPVQWLD